MTDPADDEFTPWEPSLTEIVELRRITEEQEREVERLNALLHQSDRARADAYEQLRHIATDMVKLRDTIDPA